MGVVNYALEGTPGEEQTCAELYRRLFHPLCDSAARLLGYDEARDVVQDAMLELWNRWPELPPEARSAPYVARAVRNRVTDRLRKTEEHIELTEELEATLAIQLPDEAENLLLTDMAARLDAIVAGMPPRCKEAYVLVHEQGLSGKQAAEAMGVALPTLRTHVSRMNVILRESLKRAARELDAGATVRLLAPPSPVDSQVESSVPLYPEVRHD